jgi:uncharacterized protein YciI
MNQAATGPMAEPPRGATIEAVWFVEATYAPDAAATREPFRAEHLARLVELKQRGICVEAGGFADLSTATALVRAETEQAALDLFRDDVYLRNGVWVSIHARPFRRVSVR